MKIGTPNGRPLSVEREGTSQVNVYSVKIITDHGYRSLASFRGDSIQEGFAHVLWPDGTKSIAFIVSDKNGRIFIKEEHRGAEFRIPLEDLSFTMLFLTE